nr:RNA-directed DNA polymerase, eukaryota, reverse transcriptase zinc-binding domain protein [Tanacetum cinerariifolium]
MLYNFPPPAPAAEQQPINFFIDNSRSGDKDNTTMIILIVVSLIGTVVAGGFACRCTYKRNICGKKQSAGSQRSNQKISMSVFVTNFLKNYGAKDQWNTCKIYGQVVDAYIHDRRSKAGKRFGFVRFIKRDNAGGNVGGVKGAANSYAHVVKGNYYPREVMDRSPSLVLDDSCLNQKEYSLCLLGKVKDFASLSKLKIIQASSDFNIDERVTWVELEVVPYKLWSRNTFSRIASRWGTFLDGDDREDGCFHRKRICICMKLKTNLFEYFRVVYRGKVIWTRAKEVLGWVPDFVEDIKEESDSDDDSYEGEIKNDCLKFSVASDVEGESDVEAVHELKFKEYPKKHTSDDASVGQNNVHSEDPFDIYDILNKKRDTNKKDANPEDSLKFPIGFILRDDQTISNNKGVNDVEESICSVHFRKSEVPLIGGLVIQLMDDLLRNLKVKIQMWSRLNKESSNSKKRKLKAEFADLDLAIDKGDGEVIDVNRRHEVVRLLQDVEKIESLEVAQKAKIKWAIEGAENSKYYHGVIPKGGNSSFITLILKVPNANMVKDFRPISLIRSLYKIIAKILANHLITVLGTLVNETQSAFVTDRQILDGPFILNELVQWCKKKKKQAMIFKVDFEKAYDSVRWDFLDDILKKFRFGEKWCKWIQSCLRSSRGSVIVNGSPTKEFQFYKGLKHGEGRRYKVVSFLICSIDGFWSLEGSSDFMVSSVRKLIDGVLLPEVTTKTRWIKAVHIKVNVHAWKVKIDCLPTRFNISRRGTDNESILCHICGNVGESSSSRGSSQSTSLSITQAGDLECQMSATKAPSEIMKIEIGELRSCFLCLKHVTRTHSSRLTSKVNGEQLFRDGVFTVPIREEGTGRNNLLTGNVRWVPQKDHLE